MPKSPLTKRTGERENRTSRPLLLCHRAHSLFSLFLLHPNSVITVHAKPAASASGSEEREAAAAPKKKGDAVEEVGGDSGRWFSKHDATHIWDMLTESRVCSAAFCFALIHHASFIHSRGRREWEGEAPILYAIETHSIMCLNVVFRCDNEPQSH